MVVVVVVVVAAGAGAGAGVGAAGGDPSPQLVALPLASPGSIAVRSGLSEAGGQTRGVLHHRRDEELPSLDAEQ